MLHSRAIADCGHVDDGLSGEAPERGTRRGLLVYRAWLVGSHKPWASKERERKVDETLIKKVDFVTSSTDLV